MNDIAYTVFHLFCGIGGGALGFQRAKEEFRGIRGQFITLGGVDVDPQACRDFEMLTGVPATQLDLFTREDYSLFHGREPPPTWREATPDDIRKAAGGIAPDVVFLSPPCKGFSSLLPVSSSITPKYQALNRLVPRGIRLLLEAFKSDPASLILLENVPRLRVRGQSLLDEVRHILAAHGYVFHEGFHDCGQLGGLAQHRKRYLLIARNPAKLPNFVYRPDRKRVKAIGDVLQFLPLPGDPSSGVMHRLPDLKWETWVRLALIPAGGDWRDLEKLAPNGWFHGAYRVIPWGKPVRTITSGASPSCGAMTIPDPRLCHRPRKGVFKVVKWNQPAGTITGSVRVNGSGGVAVVADPRLRPRANRHPCVYKVIRWDTPSTCVTGSRLGSGAPAIADPRLGCRPRSGTFGVLGWNQPATTIIASADVHAGASAVADPRTVKRDAHRTSRQTPIIISLDGTWHRPLTTLELAVLQGFPARINGEPLRLAGNAANKWRERIGNAVPPPAAQAIAGVMLLALLANQVGVWMLNAAGVWVKDLPAGDFGDVLFARRTDAAEGLVAD